MAYTIPAVQPSLTRQPAWKALHEHYRAARHWHLRQLFAENPKRAEQFRAQACGLYLDYSKNRINDETVRLLLQLARDCRLDEHIEAMFKGRKINVTEQRAALHIALRAPLEESILLDGVDIVRQVHAELERMSRFANAVRRKEWLGHTGKPVRNIINIGIGGSDLGPVMAFEALRNFSQRDLVFRFVSNVDGTDFAEATRGLAADETLFIVCSKTFKTLETLTNANAARQWIMAGTGDSGVTARHFVAVSANVKGAIEFGIEGSNVFGMPEWDGGRYSMDSAVGLSTMLSIGPENFRSMLSGFHAMDKHFRTTPFERNLPVLMGLLTIWYNNFFNAQTVAVLPYEQYLKRFPAYLQQLTMESNGKHVTLDGASVDYQTGPIYWGEPGTNGQHSFYQLIHQGTKLIPCDFIGFCQTASSVRQHSILIANLFAQSRALAFGENADDVRAQGTAPALVPHRVLEGNQPSNTLLARKLTPSTLGSLVALYEHSVFTQGIIWGVDSFDQWGVELGKKLAGQIIPHLEGRDEPPREFDGSTRALIEIYRRLSPRSEPVEEDLGQDHGNEH